MRSVTPPPEAEPAARFSVTFANVTTDVGPGDPLDLLLSLDADLTVSNGSTVFAEEGAPILEIAYHLAGWDQESALAVGSMSCEPKPVFRITRSGPDAVITIFDGTTVTTTRADLAAATSRFIEDVDRTARDLFATSIQELREALAPHPSRRRWRRR
jgi:hypothetical protein